MKVFVTGGTGFIGSHVIKELTAAGHEVAGLSRSDKARARLAELGAAAFPGSIEDSESLIRGAVWADAVIHCAFVHDFANFISACNLDKTAVETLGGALSGSGKIFIVTSGVPGGEPGRAVTEKDESASAPRVSEQTALSFAGEVDVRIVRPSRFVFDENLTNGFIAALIGTAAQKGVSAYAGEGGNRIHAVHVRDLAKLYLLALEKGVSGAKYHGVGVRDGAIAFREVAEAMGGRLNVPVKSVPAAEAGEHFGFLGAVVCADNPASSEITRNALGWAPDCGTLTEVLRGLA